MPQEDIEDVKRRICEWMKGRGIFIREIKSEETLFQFEGRTETQVGIVVAQPKKLFRSIVVISKLEIHPNHQEALGRLNSKEKADFVWDLKKDLIFVPATFEMEPSTDNLKSIQFTKEISFDELTDGRLIEAVDNVCRPLIWTAWVFVKMFGKPEEVH
jgi:hypothetical protein